MAQHRAERDTSDYLLGMLVLVLLACSPSQGDDRELRVSDAGDTPSDWGDDDTAEAATGDPVDGCGGGDGWAEVDGALDVAWCARVTPEYGSITDEATDTAVAAPEDTGGAFEPAPPPCGFVNLVGDIGLVGTARAPRVLYCDSDADGGVRLATYDPAAGLMETQMLASLDCSPDASAGTLVPYGEGYLAAWSGSVGSYADEGGGGDGAYGLVAARLGDDGALQGGLAKTIIGTGLGSVDVVATEPPLAVAVDWDGVLWVVPMDDSGVHSPAPFELANEMSNAAAVSFGDGVVVAACETDNGPLSLWRLDAAQAVVASVRVADSACGWRAHPSVVQVGDGIAVGWDGPLGAGVAKYDGELAEQWRYAPGEGAEAPQVAALDDGVLVFTTDGAVTRLDSAGTALATAWHPGVVDPEGEIYDLRLTVDGDQAIFLAYGMDSYTIGGGHVNSFNYVEVSSAPIP